MSALLFVPLLAVASVVGFLLAVVAAHHFLVVIQTTAAGADEPVWPDEPLYDWFWKVFYLAMIIVVWIAPGIILSRVMATGDPMTARIFLIGWFWLTFPLGLLSSLSASSIWFPITPWLFPRFAQRMGKVLQFYILSLPLVAAGGWALGRLWGTFGPGGSMTAILAAGVLAFAWLLYARLIGRLAFVLSFTNDPRKRPIVRRRWRRQPDPEPEPEPVAVGAEVSDPWQVPEEADPRDEDEEVVEAYVVDEGPYREAEPPPRSRINPFDSEEDEQPYGVVGGDEPPPDPAPPPEPEPAPRRRRPRRPRQRREDMLKEPATLFEGSAIGFLANYGCVKSLFLLGLGLALIGGILAMLEELRPA